MFLRLPCLNSVDAPNNPGVASSIIPTFQIRKLKHRETKKLFKFAMLADEEDLNQSSVAGIHTLRNAVAPLKQVFLPDSSYQNPRHLSSIVILRGAPRGKFIAQVFLEPGE